MDKPRGVRADGEMTRRRIMNVLADMERKATIREVQSHMPDMSWSAIQYGLSVLVRERLVKRSYSVRNTYRVALFGLTKRAHATENVWRVK